MSKGARRPRVVHRLGGARRYVPHKELDQVCEWWRQGGTGICLVTGIAGAGKTSLVQEFLYRVPGCKAREAGREPDLTLRQPDALFVYSVAQEAHARGLHRHLGAWLVVRHC